MKRYASYAIIAAAMLSAAPASALLFCYNGDTNPPTQMEWNQGKFTFYNLEGQAVANPGPMLLPPALSSFYCYANGAELTYLESALPDVMSRAPKVQAIGPSKGFGQVFWTGNDARFIWNNL